MCMDALDQTGYILRSRAVDADGCNLRILVEQARAIRHIITAASMHLVGTGERNPGARFRMTLEVIEYGQCFFKQRDRLDGKDIRSSSCQQIQTLRMEIREFCTARTIIAAIF